MHQREVLAACSTPFGITAVGSCHEGGPQRRLDVLNAFRHHGCRESTAACARRPTTGAQRLSASRLSGDDRCAAASTPRRVLNAFRHHGCREVDARVAPDDGHRAQRLSASRLSGGGTRTAGAALPLCSTPFGITAVGSGVGGDEAGDGVVLNAFRHHGCRETPRGLRGWSPRRCAQRLSASRLSGESDPSSPG